MEASSSGSFWVTARLCGGLKAAEKDAGKRDRLLRNFLGRYSPSATDLAIMVEIITVTAATPPVPRGESLTSAEGIALLCQTLHIDRLEDAPSRRTSVLSLKTVHELCTAARLLGPRAVLSSDAWTTICAEATTADLEVIVHLLCNNRAALIGSLTTADVLAVLSPDSAREFEETNDLVRSVSVLEVGGSPRVLAESHGVFPDEPIDAPPPPPLVLPVDVKPVSVIPPASVVKRGAEGTRVRRSCMYGATCTRHNPTHFTEYAHPGDADYHPSDARAPKAAAAVPDVPAPAAALPPVPDEDRSIDGIAPLTLLPSHVFVPVEGVTGTYQVKYCGDGVYTCNCPVWRYQLKGANARTCKHIQQLLGDAYERVRCGMDGVTPMPGVPRTTDAFRGAAPAAAPPASLVGKGMVSLLLANKANHPKTDYTGWWVSEKLDGVRAYWDGARFNSRNGNGFDAPGWFTVHLPKDVTLDGELFGGRKKFQTAVGIVKSSAAHPGWKTLTYEVFDVPSMKSSPFEERMTFLQKTIAAIGDKSPHIHFVLQRKVTGRADIDAEFDKISKLGGEGLMLRQPGSLYVGARSNTLLKVKGTEDVDALVIGYDSGDGKYVGKVGALVVKLANGKQFKVGSGLTDADRSAPPKVGAVVTVRYQELTDGGVPRFPVFVGERADGVWPPVA